MPSEEVREHSRINESVIILKNKYINRQKEKEV